MTWRKSTKVHAHAVFAFMKHGYKFFSEVVLNQNVIAVDFQLKELQLFEEECTDFSGPQKYLNNWLKRYIPQMWPILSVLQDKWSRQMIWRWYQVSSWYLSVWNYLCGIVRDLRTSLDRKKTICKRDDNSLRCGHINSLADCLKGGSAQHHHLAFMNLNAERLQQRTNHWGHLRAGQRLDFI